ncbi:MAG: glycosyltransferase [Alphaproteobacteria bacterium]|nr:glycosyltransferase [Alphaproteobacteria bacterium]
MSDVQINQPMSQRKLEIQAQADATAPSREGWIERNAFYYNDDYRFMRFLVPEGVRVLDLGCGTGRLLAELKPSCGVGVDFSQACIDVAKKKYPGLSFVVGDIESQAAIDQLSGPFDVIILSDTIGYLEDCEETLARLRPLCTPETRLVVSYYSHVWEPLLKLASRLGMRMQMGELNWLSTSDIVNLLELADFDVVRREWRQLIPKAMLGVGALVNRFFAPLPGIRRLCLRNYVVARALEDARKSEPSVSVVIPCRNERGNIESAVKRMPLLGGGVEIIFVEGHSQDGTWEEILRVQAAYSKVNIVCLRQDGVGKGDAVRKGFDQATGDILMILDADLTVAPEDLAKFFRAISSGKGEFIHGTRLVYPMQSQAMQFLNYLANRLFALLFSYLLNQRFTDTLCGTKVLWRSDYQRIVAGRAYFGEFDPFGDYDLILGAAKLNLKITEIPIRYASRSYGSTQILRFRHGLLLLRMVRLAYFKLKAL